MPYVAYYTDNGEIYSITKESTDVKPPMEIIYTDEDITDEDKTYYKVTLPDKKLLFLPDVYRKHLFKMLDNKVNEQFSEGFESPTFKARFPALRDDISNYAQLQALMEREGIETYDVPLYNSLETMKMSTKDLDTLIYEIREAAMLLYSDIADKKERLATAETKKEMDEIMNS